MKKETVGVLKLHHCAVNTVAEVRLIHQVLMTEWGKVGNLLFSFYISLIQHVHTHCLHTILIA